jgi:hypothetical protein
VYFSVFPENCLAWRLGPPAPAEGNHEIDSHGAPSGNPSGKTHRRSENNRDSRKCRRVIRRDAKQYLAQTQANVYCSQWIDRVRTDYLSMTPQAIRAPELPVGSVL